MTITLYKSRGNKTYAWSVKWSSNEIVTYSGLLNGKQTMTVLRSMKAKSNDEYANRLVKSKLNEGYVEDINKVSFKKTDSNGFPKFQKANKDLSKLIFPSYAQPKYNGVRASMSFEMFKINDDLFVNEKPQAVFKSKNGIYYNMSRIQKFVNVTLGEDFFKHEGVDLIYDGELYIHNEKLNVINSSCPYIKDGKVYKSSHNPDDVTFVIFDIFSDLPQSKRFEIINDKVKEFGLEHLKYQSCLDRKSSIYFSETIIVNSKEDAQDYTDKCIKSGFEGSIVRNMNNPYQYGLRTNSLIKIKRPITGIYKIIDVIPKDKEPETALFVLTTDEGQTFKCNPTGTYEDRKKYLDNKASYIGKSALIRYFELSGVKNVPFHSNLIEIITR